MIDGVVAKLAAEVLAVALLLLWLLSLRMRDSSIVDIFWGLGFVIVAWLGFALGPGAEPRKLLVAVLVTVWGVRLAGYLAWRNLGGGKGPGNTEDPRYQAMRRRHGDKWPLRSLFIVFGLQGTLIWIVSLPLQAAQAGRLPAELGALDFVGAGLAVAGILFESVGDFQLAAFKRRPENHGKVMDKGLWRYTRHPNYFGDFLVWWGFYAFAAATGALWTAIGPLIMSILLMRVSGVTLLEKTLRKRPGYDEYIRRTSTFFPRPPRD